MRLLNTLRRLRLGRLARLGLYSFETSNGQDEAEVAQAAYERRRSERADASGEQPRDNAHSASEADEEPKPNDEPPSLPAFDPWERFLVPAFPLETLPPALRAFVEYTSNSTGGDVSAVAMAALAACSGAIDQQFTLKMKRSGDWYVRPRVWVVLVGDPSSKKTPIISACVRPLGLQQEDGEDRPQADVRRQVQRRPRSLLLRPHEVPHEAQVDRPAVGGSAGLPGLLRHRLGRAVTHSLPTPAPHPFNSQGVRLMVEERTPMSATRRTLLGGSIGTVSILAMPGAAASAGQSEWARVVAAYRAAEAVHCGACDAIDKAEEAASKSTPPLPEALVYHWHMHGKPELFTERLTTIEAIDRWIPEGLRHVMGARRDRTLAAFADYSSARDAVERAAGLPQAQRALEGAGKRECAAYAAVRDTHAPDRRALIEKLNLIIERGDFEDGVMAVQADILAMEG